MMKPTPKRQQGFTIVELMIATLVFSMVLLVITFGVIYFTKSYYTGLNRSAVQNLARFTMKTVTESVQFTGSAIATSTDTGGNYFCAGNKEYIFNLGVQYGGGTPTAANPGLLQEPVASGCPAPTASTYADTNAQQLLGSKLRVVYFSLTNLGGQLYLIQLTLAYGDNDQLCAPVGAPGSCAAGAAALADNQLDTSDVVCKSQAGSEYCAVSSLSATVERRLQSGQLSG